jgi:hypothetical protein
MRQNEPLLQSEGAVDPGVRLLEGGKQGARVIGATGFNVRTGEFYVSNQRLPY